MERRQRSRIIRNRKGITGRVEGKEERGREKEREGRKGKWRWSIKRERESKGYKKWILLQKQSITFVSS